jgi:hypothetical protein
MYIVRTVTGIMLNNFKRVNPNGSKYANIITLQVDSNPYFHLFCILPCNCINGYTCDPDTEMEFLKGIYSHGFWA